MNHSARDYVVVIDSGGTKIKAALFGPDGSSLGTHTMSESGYIRGDVAETMRRIAETVSGVIDSVQIECKQLFVLAGVSGVNSDTTAAEAKQELAGLLPGAEVRIVNDADLIGLAAGDQPAIVVICGTGSSVVGYDGGRSVYKCSGVNEVLSDEGSAYWIGQQMLRATTKALDGRADPSRLTEAVCEHFSTLQTSALQLAIESSPHIKRAVATVSALLTPELIAQDPLASQIADTAVDELALAVMAVRRKYPMDAGQQVPVKFTGGVFSSNAYIFDSLQGKLHKQSGLSPDGGITDAVDAGYVLAKNMN